MTRNWIPVRAQLVHVGALLRLDGERPRIEHVAGVPCYVGDLYFDFTWTDAEGITRSGTARSLAGVKKLRIPTELCPRQTVSSSTPFNEHHRQAQMVYDILQRQARHIFTLNTTWQMRHPEGQYLQIEQVPSRSRRHSPRHRPGRSLQRWVMFVLLGHQGVEEEPELEFPPLAAPGSTSTVWVG